MTATDANAAPLSDSELRDIENQARHGYLYGPPRGTNMLLQMIVAYRAQAARLAALEAAAAEFEAVDVSDCNDGEPERARLRALLPRAGEPEGAGEGE